MPLGIWTDEDMRALAAPYLDSGEVLGQVAFGNASRLVQKGRIFAVTDRRILVLGKKEGIVAELPRSTQLIPDKAGRFDLTATGAGLGGIDHFTRTFGYGEKVTFGWKAFGALLAADGREGEKHAYARLRVRH